MRRRPFYFWTLVVVLFFLFLQLCLMVGGSNTTNILDVYLPYFLGFGYSAVVGGFLVKLVTDQLVSARVRENEIYSTNSWLSGALGIMERILYIGSLLMRKGEFIGVWLGFKVVGRLAYKQDKEEHTCLTAYLIGNALSIVYAVVGFKIIVWFKRGSFQAILTPLIVVGATYAFAAITLYCKQKNYFKPY